MRPTTKNLALMSAYDAGRRARFAGEPIGSCPYKIAPHGCHRRNGGTWGAVFRNYWRKGWMDEKKFSDPQ